MLKRLLAMIALCSLLASLALADDDVLALVTKGKVTSNSAGVTKLSLEDKMQVKGGYQFIRNSDFDFYAGYFTSYGYVVLDDAGTSYESVANTVLGYNSGYIVAKYRYVNNQKEYYLQYFSSKTAQGTDIWAYYGSPAYNILNEFKRKY